MEKLKTKNYITIDSNNLEDMIRSTYDILISIAVESDMCSYSYLAYNIKPYSDVKFLLAINELKELGRNTNGINIIEMFLNDLCLKTIIDPGEYLILI